MANFGKKFLNFRPQFLNVNTPKPFNLINNLSKE
jgi:hypothetical protein